MARNVMVVDTKIYKLQILLLGFKNYTQWGMLQGTMLQRTSLTTNGFINKIRMLQRTILQRTVLSIKS